MKRHKSTFLICIIIFINCSASSSQTSASNPMGKTWVVFIENSNYHTFASLEGPTQDVALMTSALGNYKIDRVIHKKDLTKQQMEHFFKVEIRDQLLLNHVNSVIFWYAGHGKLINETGYWVPVDARRDDESTYFNINILKESLESYANKLTHILVISDACESGPTFYQAMRTLTPDRSCSDIKATLSKSSQVFSSAGYDLALDGSQFTRTFANTLKNNKASCIPIESVVKNVTIALEHNNQNKPKFGKIQGLKDDDGTFFFISK